MKLHNIQFSPTLVTASLLGSSILHSTLLPNTLKLYACLRIRQQSFTPLQHHRQTVVLHIMKRMSTITMQC